MTFAEFWKRYPRKTHKKEAEREWNVLIKRGIDSERILRFLTERQKEWNVRDVKFIPYPASWLHAEDFSTDDCEAAADDKEPQMRIPWFMDNKEDEDVKARAEVLHRRLQHELLWWETERDLHEHSARCQWGEVCRYAESKRPDVPELSEIIQQMRK